MFSVCMHDSCLLLCVKDALNPICCSRTVCQFAASGIRVGLSVPARVVLFCLVVVLSVNMPQRALMFMQCESLCGALAYYLVAERKTLHFHHRFPEAQVGSQSSAAHF